ncbi:golvesin C-terminal-like domain-containing protein [Thiolapillus sp.]
MTYYARWTSASNRTYSATYEIRHAGGTTNIAVNQRENGGVWRWLGRFALDAGSEVLLHASDNGVVVADGIRVVRVEGLNGGLYPVHVDHLGTPWAVTTLGGQVVWRWESDPFGELSANEDPDGDGRTFTLNLRMPGQYVDEETGLFYNYF